jgi:hypothetical protein
MKYLYVTLALATLAVFACAPEDEPADLTPQLQALAEEANEESVAAAVQPLSLLPDQCCLINYGRGSWGCGDIEAIKSLARRLCSNAASEWNAVDWTVKGGHCSKYEECPQYTPPPPPPPPPPVGSCPTHQRCCAFGPGGDCLECFPTSQQCP